jgi:16S rRNA (cytosine967-C5)-methyltransferase
VTAREAAHSALGEYRRRAGADPRELLRGATKNLDSRDAALAARITLGVLRNMALLDYYIASASSLKMNKIEPLALDILRVAVYQLAFLDKVPPSAAVNEAVSIARRRIPRASGFVNAVLRALTSGALPEVAAATEAERLAVLYSHPLWLVKKLISTLGEAETALLLAADNAEPPVYARVNTLKIASAELLSLLHGAGIDAEESVIADTLELRGAGEIAELDAFKRGLFFVQDPSSTRAALAAGVKPGDTVIDACAAPGGKSFALAIALENRGRIISCDTPGRVHLIADGAARLGLTNIECAAADAAVFTARFAGLADAVIVDAPCSGFGVMRKKPEIRFKTEEEIAGLPELQLGILSNCASYVKPGGALVYSTCTVLKIENADVVAAFLAQNHDFAPESQAMIWAHRDGGDSFFIAVMRRKG